MPLLKFICHSYRVISEAVKFGWLPGARYTNLRDVKKFDRIGFLDIDWKCYDFHKHLKATKDTRPILTVARDIVSVNELDRIVDEANELSLWAERVVVVPKDLLIQPMLPNAIPENFILGYSIPTSYGGTQLPVDCFRGEVHLLGGHPATQRALGNCLRVVSFDCNRFTLDASFGDFFDGETFRPHHIGGYTQCIRDSIININRLWENYNSDTSLTLQLSRANSLFGAVAK